MSDHDPIASAAHPSEAAIDTTVDRLALRLAADLTAAPDHDYDGDIRLTPAEAAREDAIAAEYRRARALSDASSGFDDLHDAGGLDAARLGRVRDINDDRAYYRKDWR